MGGSKLVPQFVFHSGTAATGTGWFHLGRCACDLSPPGFRGFRLGGNSFSTISQPGWCARGGAWYASIRIAASENGGESISA